MTDDEKPLTEEEIRRAFMMLEVTYLTARRRRFWYLIATVGLVLFSGSVIYGSIQSPADDSGQAAIFGSASAVAALICGYMAYASNHLMSATRLMAIALGATPR